MISPAHVDAALAIDKPINRIGSRFMFDPATYADAAAHGFAGIDFYVAGRCGVLGDVDADVVTAALGFFEPATVRALWEQGCAAQSAARSAELFAEACAGWGRDHLGADLDYADLAELAGRVIAATDVAALPLFAGWRAMPVPDDPKGAAMHRLNVLRELRGGAHVVAVVAAGISPLDAVLSTGGAPNAALFGYPEPYPDAAHATGPLADAAAASNRMAARPLAALTDDELARFVELVVAAKAGLV